MPEVKKIMWGALLCASLLAVIPLCAGSDVGQTAGEFSLQPPEGGKSVSLKDFKGKPTLVVFWATWCGPCRREIPDLKDLHKNYSQKGLQLVAVAINFKETREDVVRFKKASELPYLVLWDEGNKVSDSYAVDGVPTLLLLDDKGVVRYRSHQIDRAMVQLIDTLTTPQGSA
jgi:thiol-disulfide isomerase/thioredoxin